jgi:hypothetical protein
VIWAVLEIYRGMRFLSKYLILARVGLAERNTEESEQNKEQTTTQPAWCTEQTGTGIDRARKAVREVAGSDVTSFRNVNNNLQHQNLPAAVPSGRFLG